MMPLAEIVQLISMPLEVVGLSLTIIEIFFRIKNESLEVDFNKAIDKINNSWIEHNKLWA